MRKNKLFVLLCLFLSFTVLFTGTNHYGIFVAAISDRPAFNDSLDIEVANYSSVSMSEQKVTYDLDGIIDKSKYTCSEMTVVRTDDNILNTTPVLIIAETDSDYTHETRGEFKNSYLAIWLAASGGYSIGLLSSECTSTAVFPNSFSKFTSQSATGFAGYSGQYPDGKYAVPKNITVTTKVEGGKISVWLTSGGVTKAALLDYSSSDYNILGAAAGHMTSQIISNNYSFSGKVWVNKDNYDALKENMPKYDSNKDGMAFEIEDALFSEAKTDFALNKIKDMSKPTFSKVTILRNDANALNTTPAILLATTDSDITHSTKGNFKESHLAMWLATSGGYAIALLNSDCGGSATWPNSFCEFAEQSIVTGFTGYGGQYPNGLYTLPDKITVTTKVADGKISVWLTVGGVTTQALKDYSSDKYSITGIAAGYLTSQHISNDYNYIANVWTALDNIKNSMPVYDSELHTDLTQLSGIMPTHFVGCNHNVNNGAKIWVDITNGATISVAPINETLSFGSSSIYSSGTIRYKSSAYQPNAAYHYPYIVLAELTEGDKQGYLVLKFPAAGQAAKLVFLNENGDDTTDYALLKTFSSVTTAIGSSHSFAYKIDVADTNIDIWIDGVHILKDYKLDEKYTADNLMVGAGMYYASFELTGYRVWRDGDVPKITIPVPVFDPETDIDLTPYAQVASSNVSGMKQNDNSYVLSQTQNVPGCVLFRKVNLEGDGTMYYHAKVNSDIVNYSSDKVYDGPSISLGTVVYEENGKSGYLVAKFTAKDGIDFRIIARNSTDVVYVGAITGMKFNYPDTDSPIRGEDSEYTVDIKLNRNSISFWVNEVCIVNNMKLSKFGNNPKKVTLSEFMPGLMTINYTGTISDFHFWCSKDDAPELHAIGQIGEEPVFKSNTDEDVTTVISKKSVFKGEGGSRKLNADGTIAIKSNSEGSGEGTDSGVYFGTDIKHDGTMYLHARIRKERTNDKTIATTAIYGGPAFRLADASVMTGESRKDGFLDILFTEQDGIDVRVREADGTDAYYLGALCIGLKVSYPDTASFRRGKGDYDVTIKLSKNYLSLWVNGVCVINEYKLYHLTFFETLDQHVDILDFAPGVLFNGETGVVDKFKVWTKKSDVDKYDTKYSYPS